MSTPASACSQAQIPAPKNRPLANFQPSIWGNQFITNTHEDKVTRASKEEEAKDLRKEVKRKLKAAAAFGSSQLLNLIDAVQRLGVAYHFEGEIEEALQLIHGSFHNASDMAGELYDIALRFRLLRQQGYNISCEKWADARSKEGSIAHKA